MSRKIEIRQKQLILDFLKRQQRPNDYGSHYGVALHKFALRFEKEFKVAIGNTIDRMIRQGEVIAVFRNCSFDEHFQVQNTVHILASYPDPKYPGQFDPEVYLLDRIPRSLIRFANSTPHEKVKAAILQRKQKAQETAEQNR